MIVSARFWKARWWSCRHASSGEVHILITLIDVTCELVVACRKEKTLCVGIRHSLFLTVAVDTASCFKLLFLQDGLQAVSCESE